MCQYGDAFKERVGHCYDAIQALLGRPMSAKEREKYQKGNTESLREKYKIYFWGNMVFLFCVALLFTAILRTSNWVAVIGLVLSGAVQLSRLPLEDMAPGRGEDGKLNILMRVDDGLHVISILLVGILLGIYLLPAGSSV